MDKNPDNPGDKASQVQVPDIGNRFVSTNGCHGTFIGVFKRFHLLSFQHSSEVHTKIFSLLDGGLCHLWRSEEHTSELQSRPQSVCRLLLEKKNTRGNT